MPTAAALEAQASLRDASQFQWYVVPLLALVIYVYSVEIERRNWNVMFAGLAVWSADWLNEIVNALVFRFTHHDVGQLVGKICQQHPQPAARRRLIIDDDDAQRAHGVVLVR